MGIYQMQQDSKKNKTQKERKQAAILTAATEVFLDVGFDAASMDVITQKAGVSKATVYSHFGNKQNLFGAIIKEQCQDLLVPLHDLEISSNDIDLTLQKIAGRFMDLSMKDSILALYRVIIAESSRFPKLARIFYENGPGQIADNLALFLTQQNENGQLDTPDSMRAAEQFFGLLMGYVHIRSLLGISSKNDKKNMDEHIASAVKTFLIAHKCN